MRARFFTLVLTLVLLSEFAAHVVAAQKDFQYGYVGFDSKTSSVWVRAVRGGS